MAVDVKSTDNSSVKSATRTLDILEFVANAPTCPSLPEISQELAIPKSSLSLLLTTLVQRDYLRHIGPRGGFGLGPASQRFADQVSRARGAVARVMPFLRGINRALNETTGYFEWLDDEMECVETQPCTQQLSYSMRIGERSRPYASACGKVLLAQLSDAELEDYLRSIELIPYTGSTVVDRDRLLAEIADIRRTGVGRAFGEYAAGVIAIAVALPRSGATPGAINVAVPESRYNAELDRAIVAQLQAACRALRTETA